MSASGSCAATRPPGLAHGETAEDKIAAIGIRLRQWVSFHGISLNVEPDLSHYAGITPCGIADAHLGVTSFADLGHIVYDAGGGRGAARARWRSSRDLRGATPRAPTAGSRRSAPYRDGVSTPPPAGICMPGRSRSAEDVAQEARASPPTAG